MHTQAEVWHRRVTLVVCQYKAVTMQHEKALPLNRHLIPNLNRWFKKGVLSAVQSSGQLIALLVHAQT